MQAELMGGLPHRDAALTRQAHGLGFELGDWNRHFAMGTSGWSVNITRVSTKPGAAHSWPRQQLCTVWTTATSTNVRRQLRCLKGKGESSGVEEFYSRRSRVTEERLRRKVIAAALCG